MIICDCRITNKQKEYIYYLYIVDFICLNMTFQFSPVTSLWLWHVYKHVVNVSLFYDSIYLYLSFKIENKRQSAVMNLVGSLRFIHPISIKLIFFTSFKFHYFFIIYCVPTYIWSVQLVNYNFSMYFLFSFDNLLLLPKK